MEKITIVTPQFERTWKLDFEHKPESEQEFLDIVNNAPFQILKGYGFGKWSTMNDCIKENISNEDRPNMISVPTYNLEDLPALLSEEKKPEPSGDMMLEIGCRQPTPKKLLEIDEDIILFPGEWYNLIPNGFMVAGLYGEKYPFEKGKSDDDIRFGCLPYGITRQIQPNKPTN